MAGGAYEIPHRDFIDFSPNPDFLQFTRLEARIWRTIGNYNKSEQSFPSSQKNERTYLQEQFL